jgi:hypothetical protein
MTSPELVSILLFLNGSIFLGSGNTRRALASFGWLDRLLKSSRVPACGQDDRTTHSVCTCTCSHSQSLQTRGSRCSRQRCLASHTTGVGGSRCGKPSTHAQRSEAICKSSITSLVAIASKSKSLLHAFNGDMAGGRTKCDLRT